MRANERVPDRVDTAMDQVQRASLEARSDRPAPDPRFEQLFSSHDPVLRLRQLGQQAIDVASAPTQPTRFTFGPCEGLNVNLVRGRRRSGCHGARS
jgi:hypothetical protein